MKLSSSKIVIDCPLCKQEVIMKIPDYEVIYSKNKDSVWLEVIFDRFLVAHNCDDS